MTPRNDSTGRAGSCRLLVSSRRPRLAFWAFRPATGLTARQGAGPAGAPLGPSLTHRGVPPAASTPSQPSLAILICGLGLLATLLGWTLLSRSFVYGVGHSQRPILEFLLLYGAALGFYLGGAVATWKAAGRGSLPLIVGVALLGRVILLPSGLIQENDVYRYVLDGQVLLQGGNPYEFSPWEVVENGTPELRRSLESEAAETVLARIGYPQIPTVYPPMAQAVFAVAAALGGWDWKSQRLLLLLFDLLALVVLLSLLDQLGLERGWILLYGWNPLLLKEVANSAHFDVLVAFTLALLLLAISLFLRTSGRGWLLLAALALAAAVLCKLYPILLAPAVVILVWRVTRDWKAVGLLAGVSALGVLLGFAPFAGIGVERLFRGLLIYGSDWQMNEGAFSLLQWLAPQPRLWAAGICLLVAIGLPLLQPAREGIGLARQSGWVILIWFLVMPAPFPWYAIPLAVPLAVAGSPPLVLGTLALSGMGALYYLRFYFDYHSFDPLWWEITRGLEHVSIWLAVGFGWFWNRRRGRSSAGS